MPANPKPRKNEERGSGVAATGASSNVKSKPPLLFVAAGAITGTGSLTNALDAGSFQ